MYDVSFIYAHNIRAFNQIARRTLTVNIASYIINTFYRCKISYKNLNAVSFYEILRMIRVVRECSQQINFNAKDVVNMGSI